MRLFIPTHRFALTISPSYATYWGIGLQNGADSRSNFSYDHSGVPHAGVGTGPARVVMASVAVSVLTCLALIYIVWCIRTGYGEHLIRRHGTCLK